ncbi:S-adenosylmethionine decarboxylase related protein [Psychrobacillus sp. FJAT-21963]|uniref:S-adenosylmethionine decarboxylase related protein n=1 Tax=Psychrobacillus sp. FJAT-21963 TaxID=1712028 RepID=UPI00070017C4|nr:S-adenosylmethionine decarboxylase related protein [Psychrobacillus sp. FJAT-21963]KQL35849.1 S-adenosylmethionine decarboxylase related protein [Psychrobacillus sp. FJAT-21963]
MNVSNTVISILGSSGGVAKSILSVLNQSVSDTEDPIHCHIKHSKIHLIDQKQREECYFTNLFPNLMNQFEIHQFDLNDINYFRNHLKQSMTTVVIDVSRADTVKMLEICDQLGIKYVNTALENTIIDGDEKQDERFGLIERLNILEKKKDLLNNSTSIIGSGMNPGVVQWMAIELLNMHASEGKALGCYIVEHDNTFYKNNKIAKENVIYTTWSPESFLDEAILNYPMFMKQHTPHFLYEKVYNIEYKVSLGDKQFYGCLMPHEEVLTLGKQFDFECGFLYKVNDHTTELIRSNIDELDKLWSLEKKVLDPLESPLIGEDLIGVLLVYEDKECFIYNIGNNNEILKKFKTNATYFQVACGVYASLAVLLLDQIPKGSYYVDELLLKTRNHYGKYLSYYMTDFVIGENKQSDGLLHQRLNRP